MQMNGPNMGKGHKSQKALADLDLDEEDAILKIPPHEGKKVGLCGLDIGDLGSI